MKKDLHTVMLIWVESWQALSLGEYGLQEGKEEDCTGRWSRGASDWSCRYFGYWKRSLKSNSFVLDCHTCPYKAIMRFDSQVGLEPAIEKCEKKMIPKGSAWKGPRHRFMFHVPETFFNTEALREALFANIAHIWGSKIWALRLLNWGTNIC